MCVSDVAWVFLCSPTCVTYETVRDRAYNWRLKRGYTVLGLELGRIFESSGSVKVAVFSIFQGNSIEVH